jgi:hypothetical protein
MPSPDSRQQEKERGEGGNSFQIKRLGVCSRALAMGLDATKGWGAYKHRQKAGLFLCKRNGIHAAVRG